MKRNLYILILMAFGFKATAQKQDFSWSNLPKAAVPLFKKDTFNIIKYGALSDGITLNTKSIIAAITACNKNGGGVVLIPQGFWLTGPIVFKSNVNVCLDKAALLQFTKDKTQYPLIAGNYEGHPSPRNQSPISGSDLTNIAITGSGIIDGFGDAWRAMGRDYLTDREWKQLVASGGIVSSNGKSWYPSESYVKGINTADAIVLKPGKNISDYEPMKDFYRPNMVVFTDCKKILLQNTTFQNSPAWCLHMLLCEDLTLKNVRVFNPWNAQNGDGIDVESCKNVVIEGSSFSTGDDGICVKSGRDEEEQIVDNGQPTAWCQQHDGHTLAPAWARKFEPPSICNKESAELVVFLMTIQNPDKRLIEAIQKAVIWFKQSAIKNTIVQVISAPRLVTPARISTTDRIVVKDTTAAPIWTRYNELKTHRPLFCNRDSKVVYSLAEVDRERRDGYAWYTYAPQQVLNKYADWQKNLARKN